MVERIPESEWVWCGYQGHFIGHCQMHLHTRVGDYRISTVGDYKTDRVYDPESHNLRDRLSGEPAERIGSDRKYETFVFRVTGEGNHGEGEPVDWSEIDSDGYNEPEDAERGHMEMCRKYATLAAVPA